MTIQETFYKELQPERLMKSLAECYPGITDGEAVQLANAFRTTMFSSSRQEFNQRMKEYKQLTQAVSKAINKRSF